MRPERLGEFVTASDSVAIHDKVGEQEASLPPGQRLIDPSTSHSGHEAPAKLNPRPSVPWLPVGHRPKLAPTPGGHNLSRTERN